MESVMKISPIRIYDRFAKKIDILNKFRIWYQIIGGHLYMHDYKAMQDGEEIWINITRATMAELLDRCYHATSPWAF